MKKVLVSSLLFLVMQTGWSQTNFDWTMALSANVPVSFSQPIDMTTGDNFSLYLKSENPCYCYIIVQNSDQSVQVVKSSRLTEREEVFIGPITIHPPAGREIFYVVMTQTEQRNLSSKISTFERNSTQRNARAVIDEVQTLQRGVSILRENPEKPIFMGGTFRGANQYSGNYTGSEFSGSNAYVKRITINH